MHLIRNLSKNDFLIVILAVFISWPSCNGVRIDFEKKIARLQATTQFTAASHIMGTARVQHNHTAPQRIAKTVFVVFVAPSEYNQMAYSVFQKIISNGYCKKQILYDKEILFLKLLI